MACQRQWLYLEPIFSSDDINRQLPVEGKRYQTMERMWRKIMNNANDNTAMLATCRWVRLLPKSRGSRRLITFFSKTD